MVGCKDFAVNSELMEFSQIKNTIELAPVFDNGNALFYKRTISVSERRGKDTSLVRFEEPILKMLYWMAFSGWAFFYSIGRTLSR